MQPTKRRILAAPIALGVAFALTVVPTAFASAAEPDITDGTDLVQALPDADGPPQDVVEEQDLAEESLEGDEAAVQAEPGELEQDWATESLDDEFGEELEGVVGAGIAFANLPSPTNFGTPVPYPITVGGYTYETGDEWPTEGCAQGMNFGLTPGDPTPLLTLCGENEDGAPSEIFGVSAEGDLDILVKGANEVRYPDSDNPSPAIDVQGKLTISGEPGDQTDPAQIPNRLQLFGDQDGAEPVLAIPADPSDLVIGGADSNLVVEVMQGRGPLEEELTVDNPDYNFYIAEEDGEDGPPPGPPMGFEAIKISIDGTLVLDDADCGSVDADGQWAWDNEDCNPFTGAAGFTANEQGGRWSASADDGSWTLEPLWQHGPSFTSPNAFTITIAGAIGPVVVEGGSDWRFVNLESDGSAATVAADGEGYSLVAQNNEEVDAANLGVGRGVTLLGGISSTGWVSGGGGQIGTADNPSAKGVTAWAFDTDFDGFTIYTSGPAFVGQEGAEGGLWGHEKPGMMVLANGGTLTVHTTADPATVNTGYLMVNQGGEIAMSYPGDLGEGATPAAQYFDDGKFSDNPEENEEFQRLGVAVAEAGTHPEFQYVYEATDDHFVLTSTMGMLALFEVFSNTPNGTFEIEAARGYIFGSYEPPGQENYRQIQYMIEVGSTVTMKAAPELAYQFVNGVLQAVELDGDFPPPPPELGRSVGGGQGALGSDGVIDVDPQIDGDVATYTFAMPDQWVEATVEFSEYGSSAVVADGVDAGIADATLGALDALDLAQLDQSFGGTVRMAVAPAQLDKDAEAAFAQAAGAGRIVGDYVGLTLNQVVLQGADDPAKAWVRHGEIEELTTPVQVTFDLEGDMAGNSDYVILREHNGQIEALDATYEDGKLSFETDQFSTFAVAYKAAPGTDSGAGTSGATAKPGVAGPMAQSGATAAWVFWLALGVLASGAFLYGTAATSRRSVQ